MLLCSHTHTRMTLTCCFSTRFFTPSITNWEPVFITLENRLVGGERERRRRRRRRRRPGLGWWLQPNDQMKEGVMKVCREGQNRRLEQPEGLLL